MEKLLLGSTPDILNSQMDKPVISAHFWPFRSFCYILFEKLGEEEMSLIFFPALRRFDFLFMFELHRGFLCFNFHAREFFLPLFFLLLLRSYLPIRCPQMMFLETLGRRRPGQLWAAVWQQQGQRQRQGRRWRHPTSSGRLPSFLAKLVTAVLLSTCSLLSSRSRAYFASWRRTH